MGILDRVQPISQTWKKKNNASVASVGGINIKCPKCGASIVVKDVMRGAPIRCAECFYPFVTRSDLLHIVSACEAEENKTQMQYIKNLLGHMSEFFPEAGTALAKLAIQHSFLADEEERWNLLSRAYNAGDDSACAWLDQLCVNKSADYEKYQCKNCGAPRYRDKRHASPAFCPYCRCED